MPASYLEWTFNQELWGTDTLWMMIPTWDSYRNVTLSTLNNKTF